MTEVVRAQSPSAEFFDLVRDEVAAGLVLAFVSTGWLSSMVHGVSPTDPRVYGGAAIFLLITAVAVAWLPARRASRLDPLAALRGHSPAPRLSSRAER